MEPVTVIHGVDEPIVHEQPSRVVTVALADPPAAVADSEDSETAREHAAAACEIAMERPAIVMEPVRANPVGFGATL